MSRMLAIMALVACGGLGSCVSAPANPGFVWTYQNNAGEGPKLAYGAPASDDIVLMMTCEPGAQRVDVSLMGGSPQAGLTLTSGESRQALTADLVAAPGMGQMIQASTHPASAPLAGFARTGALSLVDRGRTVNVDASPTERRVVTRFFEACRA